MSVSWDYYDKFVDTLVKYLPKSGEGMNKATQAVTAVNKLVYKWYNDGDVYDTTGTLAGWMNDLSSYANWLYANITDLRPILDDIYNCRTEGDYEDLLKKLADYVFDDDYLSNIQHKPLSDSIYHCNGPFEFVDRSYDDEEDYEEDDDEDDEDDEEEENY